MESYEFVLYLLVFPVFNSSLFISFSGTSAVWIGLKKRFEFTDGSIYDYDLPNGTFTGSCLSMTRNQTVTGGECDSDLPYICSSTQYVGKQLRTLFTKLALSLLLQCLYSLNLMFFSLVTMLDEVALDLIEIFDDITTSCIPTLDLLRHKDVYSGNIYFSKYNSTMDQNNITLRATFDGKVKCGWRRVNLSTF